VCAQESAVANVASLDQLVSWVARHKGGRSVVGQVTRLMVCQAWLLMHSM
jgi:hypothetical protein